MPVLDSPSVAQLLGEPDEPPRVGVVALLRRDVMVIAGAVIAIPLMAVSVVVDALVYKPAQAVMLPTMVIAVIAILATARLASVYHQRFLRGVVHPLAQLAAALEHGETATADNDGRVAAEVHALSCAVERVTTMAQVRSQELGRLLAVSREMAEHLNVRHVMRAAASSALDISGAEAGLVWLVADGTGLLEPAFDTRHPQGVPRLPAALEGEKVVRHALECTWPAHRQTEWGGVLDGYPEGEVEIVAMPVCFGGSVVAVLELHNQKPRALRRGARNTLETLLSSAATALQASRMHESTRLESDTDALTQLFNRRRFDADLALECERSRRYDQPLCVVMLDVDNFKGFNDRYGHKRGDEALQLVARVLKTGLRGTDTAYRYGGEEFVLLLRETPGGAGGQVVERLRRQIDAESSDTVRITLSAGLSTAPESGTDPSQLVSIADSALYEAKRRGRNMLVVSRPRAVVSVDDGTQRRAGDPLQNAG